VSYDREEWRRPWRPADTPAHGAGVRVGGAEPDASPDEPTWARPDGSASGTPVGGVDPTTPIARFPQPPPSAWDAGSEGPGSPAGSVRPPDTTGTVEAPGRTRRAPGLLLVAVVALLSAAIGAGLTLAVMLPDTAPAEPEPAPDPVSAPTIQLEGEAGNVVPAVAQAVTPSVVRIDVSGAGALGPGQSIGSGVIYRSDGYILTNHHVINGAEQVRVRLSSGDLLDAEIVGSDQLNDLAVVRVDRTGLPAINLRPEDEPLIVGETVIAIGSPFGLDATVTSGIISALNRDITVDEEAGARVTIPFVIQTDAAINPGNSGGALVDTQGRLVGINTAILTRTGGSQGVGFAVPADQAIESADQLIEQGFVRHPLLGVTGQDVTPDIAEDFGLDASRGAIIESVQPGTGAADAGVRPGDIVVEIDGEPIATMSEVVAAIRSRQPGDVIRMGIVREGETLEVEVTIGERPR
jgi:S1-C subfamily serine protease